MADLKDIAAAAGVSPSVVSRVLRGDPQARVKDSTRARIVAVAAKLGYVANQRSLSLRFGRSGAIGLVVPDVTNAAFADLLTGVEKAAHLRNVSVLLTQMERWPTGLDTLRTLIKQGRVDGLLVQRREDYDPEVLKRDIEPGLPVVLVNSMLPNRAGSVILDDVRGAALAVQHLIDLGHRDIAHVSGPVSLDTAQRRRLGYEKALNGAGIAPRPEWIIDADWEASAGAEAARKLLMLSTRPTAVFVGSVNAAIGFVSEVQRNGINVPHDLSVNAMTTTWVSEAIYPALTTVRMPLQAVGTQGLDMLLDHLDGQPLRDIIVKEPAPELLWRQSTARRSPA